MIPAINDPQLRASAEALAPRRRLSFDKMLHDIATLEDWLIDYRFFVRVSITVHNGPELRWGWASGRWRITVTDDGVTQHLRIAPPKVVAAAFPHLVDLVRLIGELARNVSQ